MLGGGSQPLEPPKTSPIEQPAATATNIKSEGIRDVDKPDIDDDIPFWLLLKALHIKEIYDQTAQLFGLFLLWHKYLQIVDLDFL